MNAKKRFLNEQDMKNQILPKEIRQHIQLVEDIRQVLAKNNSTNSELLKFATEHALGAYVNTSRSINTTDEIDNLLERCISNASIIAENTIDGIKNTPEALISILMAACLMTEAGEDIAKQNAKNSRCNASKIMGLDDLKDLKQKKDYTADDILNMSVKDLLNALNK